ncbi:MAG: PfkB family carbohydrate kinase [Chloroflexi bacterium]|nr:PfkB family carbohydrate kinase [Chloroflexota bacterium]
MTHDLEHGRAGAEPVDFVCVGTVMLDDIQYPGMPPVPATLGGSAVHAGVGMRMWTRRVGIVARGSPALPAGPSALLHEYAFDVRGVSRVLRQPARATQVFDAEEGRHERFSYPPDGLAGLRVSPSDVPPDYYQARGFHLLVGGVEEHLALVEAIRARGDGLILVEPYYDPIQQVPRGRLFELLASIDAFAPDLNEARAICGTDHLPTLLAELGRAGTIIIIRMGKHGAVAYDPRAKRTVEVPAVTTRVTDVTGAGNAFSGGYLVGYVAGRDLERAAQQGAVSASFAIEQFGPAPPSAVDETEVRDERLRRLQGTSRP